MISEENIYKAIRSSSKGKRQRADVQSYYLNPENHIEEIQNYIANFPIIKHTPIEIYDGISRKKRLITVPCYKEQIIHHMVMNILMPIFKHGMYEHSYGSIPNRGAHKGRKFIEKWIKHDRKNVKYCLKMDIKKYFNSIPHNVLKEKLNKIISDKHFLNLLYKIIDVNDIGIPIGFYTSQWFANWYLQDLDHYIKEILHAKYYMRYMDDMVIFGSNKRKLHQIRKCITEYLENNLGLHMKENWQVFRFDYVKNNKHYGKPLDFMGFKFYRNKVVLRKSILLKATRKAKRIYKKGFCTIYDARQMMAYNGWFKYTNTYSVYLQRIKPYINFKNIKTKIAKYDRKMVKDNEFKLLQS